MRDRTDRVRRTWAALAVALTATTWPVAHEVSAAPGGATGIRPRAHSVAPRDGDAARTADAIAPRLATEVAPTGVEVTALGRASAREQVGKRKRARALATVANRIEREIELSPRKLADGGAVMNFHGALEVSAEHGWARFAVLMGVGGRTELRIPVRNGHKYLLECGATPGYATWELSWRSGTKRNAVTATGSEHPAFVFTATTSGSMRLYLEAANVQTYGIHTCTITSVG